MRILEEHELRDRETRIILGSVIRKSGRLLYVTWDENIEEVVLSSQVWDYFEKNRRAGKLGQHLGESCVISARSKNHFMFIFVLVCWSCLWYNEHFCSGQIMHLISRYTGKEMIAFDFGFSPPPFGWYTP